MLVQVHRIEGLEGLDGYDPKLLLKLQRPVWFPAPNLATQTEDEVAELVEGMELELEGVEVVVEVTKLEIEVVELLEAVELEVVELKVVEI